jgi:uncharacterized repeat protein (TIGR03843 family)
MKVTHIHTARALDDPICIPIEDAIAVVEKGEINEEVGLMRWGSNYTFLVNAILDGTQLLAVYKPRQGERPLWDFPDETLCNRETASYVVSEALGWFIVPPTFLREGTRGIGSVQLFIDHNPEEHYFTFDKLRVSKQLERMAAFDAVINNADRKGGHCLIDADEHIWGIDQGLAFNSSYKLRTVIWDYAGKPIPQAILDELEKLCKCFDDDTNETIQKLSDLLSEREMRMLKVRVERLIDNQIFPLPRSGPNRPWPAV